MCSVVCACACMHCIMGFIYASNYLSLIFFFLHSFMGWVGKHSLGGRNSGGPQKRLNPGPWASHKAIKSGVMKNCPFPKRLGKQKHSWLFCISPPFFFLWKWFDTDWETVLVSFVVSWFLIYNLHTFLNSRRSRIFVALRSNIYFKQMNICICLSVISIIYRYNYNLKERGGSYG